MREIEKEIVRKERERDKRDIERERKKPRLKRYFVA